MGQTKKDAKIISMKLKKSVFDNLDKFCQETGLSRTVAVEKILERYFTEYFSNPIENRGIFNR